MRNLSSSKLDTITNGITILSQVLFFFLLSWYWAEGPLFNINPKGCSTSYVFPSIASQQHYYFLAKNVTSWFHDSWNILLDDGICPVGTAVYTDDGEGGTIVTYSHCLILDNSIWEHIDKENANYGVQTNLVMGAKQTQQIQNNIFTSGLLILIGFVQIFISCPLFITILKSKEISYFLSASIWLIMWLAAWITTFQQYQLIYLSNNYYMKDHSAWATSFFGLYCDSLTINKGSMSDIMISQLVLLGLLLFPILFIEFIFLISFGYYKFISLYTSSSLLSSASTSNQTMMTRERTLSFSGSLVWHQSQTIQKWSYTLVNSFVSPSSMDGAANNNTKDHSPDTQGTPEFTINSIGVVVEEDTTVISPVHNNIQQTI